MSNAEYVRCRACYSLDCPDCGGRMNTTGEVVPPLHPQGLRPGEGNESSQVSVEEQ